MSDASPSIQSLPGFTRSLLRVKIPVMATLASKKQTMRQVLELAPGSIIAFDKPCEELLTLEAAGRNVALGEVVKVGDKFGLRIKQIVLPDERFKTVRKPG